MDFKDMSKDSLKRIKKEVDEALDIKEEKDITSECTVHKGEYGDGLFIRVDYRDKCLFIIDNSGIWGDNVTKGFRVETTDAYNFKVFKLGE